MTAFTHLSAAPTRVQRPRGKAISPTEIRLTWRKPLHPNGVLKPYQASCVDIERRGTPQIVTTKDSRTTSAVVGNLIPDTKYQCSVVASTVPVVGKDPAQFQRRSAYSNPISTKAQTPSRVRRPTGKAISSTEIKVKWTKPKHPNGILKPYKVTCFTTSHGGTANSVTTKDNETTSTVVANLIPDTEYQCMVVASTTAAVGQDPAKCESRSALSALIRTLR
ncbi:unnamed protein product [Hydatigera taeniaeformis]|uniref:Fibronectin type-III domain-containing protein n=1 Tax=Hydatigena taeniaeformis TaxID=6205 RepID=A0A0R3X5H7_HYDTA|nr:unnamed protein product [Hydatigera taeniaeformis]